MTKLYKKSEIWFSVIWIVVYVVGASLTDTFSSMLGVEKCLTLPFLVVMSAVLTVWILKNKLNDKYGLCKTDVDLKYFLYFLPLLVLISVNFWFGVNVSLSIVEVILFIFSMILVGYLEEIIFRGLLFKAMAKDSLKWAIVVSSLTFGIGHIVNLISSGGEHLVANLCQIVYATAVGFLFVIMFHRGKTLIPCIVAHSLVNATSVFQGERGMDDINQIISAVVIVVVAVLYALFIIKFMPKKEEALEVKSEE